jgi:uncharacterized membrane protein (UPF0182 family)
MLLRIFKGTGPGVIFLIIIILITVWVSAILNQRLHPRFIYESDPMPLYSFVKLLIHNSHNLGVILSFLLVSLMAFLMVNFNTTVFFIPESGYPGFNFPYAGNNENYGWVPQDRDSL